MKTAKVVNSLKQLLCRPTPNTWSRFGVQFQQGIGMDVSLSVGDSASGTRMAMVHPKQRQIWARSIDSSLPATESKTPSVGFQ
jgi:hypothetical protein